MFRGVRGVGLLMCVVFARGMEPLALLATQPVWQAGKPVEVEVDYDGALATRRFSARAETCSHGYMCSASTWRHRRDCCAARGFMVRGLRFLEHVFRLGCLGSIG